MCYAVYLATDCPDDISRRSSELVRFERPALEAGSVWPPALTHESRWFVGSKSHCSCTFRHLDRQSADLGFGAPVDWFPEDQDALDATRQLYEVLQDIVQREHRVQVLDCWNGNESEAPVALDVTLSEVPMEHFRLFEGYVFNLTR